MKGLRAGLAVLTMAVLGALTSACSAGGPGDVSSDGACAGPTLVVEPATAAPGDTVTVTGEGMIDGCDDHQGVDDDGTVRSFETQEPMRRVEIDLVLGDEQVTLASVDADEQGRFVVEVTMPAELTGADSAEIAAPDTHAEPVEVAVAVAP